MDIDPTLNIVVFKVKGLLGAKTYAQQAPTQSANGVEQAWLAIQAEQTLKPAKVVEIYSEWGPSDEDEQFLRATFPKADYSYSFSRPENEEDWDAAFDEAAQQMLEAAGVEMPSMDAEETSLLPVLRNDDDGDMMAEIGVYREVGAGLAISLANVGMTSRGTIGIDYLMRGDIEDGEEVREQLFNEAWDNLRKGLKIQGGETQVGGKLITISHPSDHAASAISLPDFYDQASAWLEVDKVFVAIPDPGNLLLAAPDSKIVDDVTQMVLASEYWGAVALTPACFHLSKAGLERVATRPQPSE